MYIGLVIILGINSLGLARGSFSEWIGIIFHGTSLDEGIKVDFKMSNEKNPGWLGYIGGFYYPIIWGF